MIFSYLSLLAVIVLLIIILHSFFIFSGTNYRRGESEFVVLSIYEKEQATPHLIGVFQVNWWVLVLKIFLRSRSRWILPSCDRTSVLPRTSKATRASYSAKRTDLHQHETVLESFYEGRKLKTLQHPNGKPNHLDAEKESSTRWEDERLVNQAKYPVAV